MRQIILLVGAMLLGTTSFADSAANQLSQSLGLAWKTPSTAHVKQSPNDITIVYGGADVSNSPAVA